MEQQKEHWNRVYATKQANEVSWTQAVPQTSLDFINGAGLPKNAGIIDIGGGDSRLVDFLLDAGFENITVLDISEHALAKARQRLGERANNVNWIVSDITDFIPTCQYTFWHDRATFHFLTQPSQIATYLTAVRRAVPEQGVVTIGTFNENGPTKCSGLDIRQYSEEMLTTELNNGFEKKKCINEDHTTPFGTTQSFLFCSFQRISA
jgi:ubiquinone/menaquinone biosynthesis C-methylase UbiE